MTIQETRKILGISEKTLDKYSVEEIFDLGKARWLYRGLPGEPHAFLHSGVHTGEYFNVSRVTQFPNLRRTLAKRIVQKIEEGFTTIIDVIVSSSEAARAIGQAVSDELGALSVFTEKKGKQIWTGRFSLPWGVSILQVEDLVTSLDTARQVKQAVIKANPKVYFLEIPYSKGPNVTIFKTLLATIVYRPSHLSGEEDYQVIPLIKKEEVHTWRAEECPLCKKGSKPLRPKENWDLFQGFMKQES